MLCFLSPQRLGKPGNATWNQSVFWSYDVWLGHFKMIFKTMANIYDGVFEKIVNGEELSTIFAKRFHHRCLIGS